MKNLLKGKKEIKGITLVALVITIIVLLILAGVSIATLAGENGILGNAEKAIGKSENAQIEENETLADYENEIAGYVGGTRENSPIIKSLIKTDDTLYNTTEGGFVFNTPTTYADYTSNNYIITLTEPIKNYDYIIFEYSTYYNTDAPGYFLDNTLMIQTQNNTNNAMALYNPSLANWNQISLRFQDNNKITIIGGMASTEIYNKMKITDIKGIKY